MADLGTITAILVPVEDSPSPVIAITDYNVERGRPLGTLGVIDNSTHQPGVGPVFGYVVRQIRILYRQLWPSHGQRFPQ